MCYICYARKYGNCRNELVWNQRGSDVVDVVESAKVVFRQWQNAQDRHFDNFLGFTTHENGDEHWRLDRGNVELGNNASPECAEAMGIKKALSWIKEHQMNDVSVESDCLSLVTVQAIRGSPVLLCSLSLSSKLFLCNCVYQVIEYMSRSEEFYGSRIGQEFARNETVDPFMYLQTVDGDILKLEVEVGWQCPYLWEAYDCGFGFNRSQPVYMSPGVSKEALEMIFGYLRFSRKPGRSCEECQLFIDEILLKKDEHTLWMLLRAARCLQLQGLFEMIRDTLAQNTEKSSLQIEQDLSKSSKQCVKEEGLRARLQSKLLEKKNKRLDEVENTKNAQAEVEAEKREDRSIDDLLSFINGDGDNKEVQTSKKKKKNRNKGKEKKKTSSSSAFTSTEGPASKKVTENREQDMNSSHSANRSSSAGATLKQLGIQDVSFNVEGDTDDDGLDPAQLEEIDRLAC
ncbi:SCF ubiquitin ligase, Skp1 component [Heracleum sosnowskyi]|uniref:SCF ubiquitin ligase, Skp1 component n=1 Tax=Heracleum sosnowskyi TaxID=360622 RepID=A0AAD8MIK3_9APIA|nr:SCF ubiquitin ligase, Skp1 component [Heracleum sosnowskyi]